MHVSLFIIGKELTSWSMQEAASNTFLSIYTWIKLIYADSNYHEYTNQMLVSWIGTQYQLNNIRYLLNSILQFYVYVGTNEALEKDQTSYLLA